MSTPLARMQMATPSQIDHLQGAPISKRSNAEARRLPRASGRPSPQARAPGRRARPELMSSMTESSTSAGFAPQRPTGCTPPGTSSRGLCPPRPACGGSAGTAGRRMQGGTRRRVRPRFGPALVRVFPAHFIKGRGPGHRSASRTAAAARRCLCAAGKWYPQGHRVRVCAAAGKWMWFHACREIARPRMSTPAFELHFRFGCS
ncbi:unnamed protein product, partial [Amoebophrya sp. A120]|eukprot:GSA120T00009848001.1